MEKRVKKNQFRVFFFWLIIGAISALLFGRLSTLQNRKETKDKIVKAVQKIKAPNAEELKKTAAKAVTAVKNKVEEVKKIVQSKPDKKTVVVKKETAPVVKQVVKQVAKPAGKPEKVSKISQKPVEKQSVATAAPKEPVDSKVKKESNSTVLKSREEELFKRQVSVVNDLL